MVLFGCLEHGYSKACSLDSLLASIQLDIDRDFQEGHVVQLIQ